MNPAWPFSDLADNEVHVWRRSFQSAEGDIASHFAILSVDEKTRATRSGRSELGWVDWKELSLTPVIICLQITGQNPLMRASVKRMLVIGKLSIGAF